MERRNRTWRWTLLAAAAIGLVVGIVGTWLLTGAGEPSEPAPIVTIRLEPLTGKTGTGSAELFRTAGGTELKVGSTGLGQPTGFFEVWLINSDGKRMVSLGVLDAAGAGTFGVPANVIAQGYRIVDVSLEPNDGNPEHSRDSIIRGNLPS